MLTVKIQSLERIAFPYAAREAPPIGRRFFRWHGAQAHTHFAVVCRDDISDEVGVRLAIVLRQPCECGGQFVAEDRPVGLMLDAPIVIGGLSERNIALFQAATRSIHLMSLAYIVPESRTVQNRGI